MSFPAPATSTPTRALGYPIDRPFGDRTIAQTIAAQRNMATSDITIRWT